ncbi:hypothetical protein FHETE_2063 [Fusarium heterosporum]|uniref:Uncharacterized protein n=1 Tax=Fusarium heterosporum TaxID=42747 RepID=A0A8H5TYE9_FUSHE|nr:hypothetical protein FHETE_2063 [Fusarium heterosporum]
MHFATTIASLVFLAGSATANCFGSGANWPGAYNVMLDYADKECHQGAFTGTFAPGEIKYKCIQYGSGSKLEFSVRNKNDRASLDLGDDDCTKEFRKDVYNCARGGWHDESGWEFTADPNDGTC